jgi:recombination associated protein RdgC
MAPFFRGIAMWFKNLQVYRLTAPWAMTPDELEEKLAPQAFQPCTSLEPQSQGWLSPRENGRLVHTVNKQMLILLGTEKKLLPATVVNQVTKARAAELEEQQGFAPGRKQMRELKERVADELLPRAFSIQRSTWTWIDPVNGWLVVDAGSPGKADEVFKMLLKAIDKLPVESLRVVHSPQSCMTNWLATDEAPSGFTVDQDTELRAAGDSKATVRYVRHTLEPDDVRRHIESGKQCTRLAMTWDSRVSFVLTESLAIKRIAPLDVIKEGSDSSTKNDDERFDSDLVLMSGELNRLLTALVETLGGEMKVE